MVYDVDFVKNDLLVDFSESIIGKHPGSGTSDYKQLSNKPSINGHELIGNLTNADLDISSETDKTLNVSDMAADSKIVGDRFNSLMGNLLPKIMNITTPPSTISVTWNAEKNSVDIDSTSSVYYTYSLYETAYDIEGHISGWSEYLEYGKSYNIKYNSTNNKVSLYVVDSNGTHYYDGDATFYVEEGDYWAIAFEIPSGEIHASIDISMPFDGSLTDLLSNNKKHTAVLG